MRGDKLIIDPHHTARANDICDLLDERLGPKYSISVGGESGSGKSELASEIARILNGRGLKSGVLQQDDYFVFPPKTNHEMRRNNLDQVGPYEVKLDFMDSNLRSYIRGESPIYKPLVYFEENRIETEEMDVEGLRVLIAEGTYTSLLEYIDMRIFIDLDFTETLSARKRRARDTFEPFVEDVLTREHEIISQHKKLADVVIPDTYDRIMIQSAI